MPTIHVGPDSDGLLAELSESLWKSRKVLVITGAGISTNSGIPDFRSENGLYSLIQAQYDAASTQDAEPPSVARSFYEDGPPAKRRKLLDEEALGGLANQEGIQPLSDSEEPKQAIPVPAQSQEGEVNSETSPSDGPPSTVSAPTGPVSPPPLGPSAGDIFNPRAGLASSCLPPEAVADAATASDSTAHASTESSSQSAPASSLESELSSLPFSSSPLSSPPPILFDPYKDLRSTLSRSETSSSSSSEAEETPPSHARFSRSAASGRNSLPQMKGRDLFDASIWSDPLKTSVFYTFATTLRQKVKEVVPTTTHHFLSRLRDSGKLVRCYTQNIDEIEQKVGLTTSLVLGPGNKGRFSTRQSSRLSLASSQPAAQPGDDDAKQEPTKAAVARDPCDRGVECVFLHGSLHALRCFHCGQTSQWDEDGREEETMSGRQPTCPRCQGATAAREERGKRALGVGKLRPDIVLYGEEHPNAHLISPIVQHDLSLVPDLMLILGTSLRVHGLKVIVKEFAKAVHSKAGKVVFVNFTKPPDSVWSDIIDFWVEWDCDSWVDDLKKKKPALWLPPGSVGLDEARRETTGKGKEKGQGKGKAKAKGKRHGDGDHAQSREKKPKPSLGAGRSNEDSPDTKRDSKRPVAIRDHKANGAYLVWKILRDLTKISGPSASPSPSFPSVALETTKSRRPRAPRKSSASASLPSGGQSNAETIPSGGAKAEGQLKKRKLKLMLTLDAEQGLDGESQAEPQPQPQPQPQPKPESAPDAVVGDGRGGDGAAGSEVHVPAANSSIVRAVKSNPRKRKPKIIDGVEVALPVVGTGKRRASSKPRTSSPKVDSSSTSRPPPALGGKENPPWPYAAGLGLVPDRSRTPPRPPGLDRIPKAMRLPPPRLAAGRDAARRVVIPPRLAPLSAGGEPRRSTLPAPTTLEPRPTGGPCVSISPNLRSWLPQRTSSPFYRNTFFFSDPLLKQLESPPYPSRNPDAWAGEQERRAAAAEVLTGFRSLSA